MKRVTVILSEKEYREVRTSAGLVPLSRWFKNLAIGGAEPSRAGTGDSIGHPRPDLGETPRAEMPTAPTKKEKSGRSKRIRSANVSGAKEVPVVGGGVAVSERVAGTERGRKKCVCQDSYEQHWDGGRCLADNCHCGKYEEEE